MNFRILTVDDTVSIHEDYRKILATTSYPENETELLLFGRKEATGPDVHFEIESALHGEDAYNLVKYSVASGERYALAFVDVRMPPGWDGLETVTRLWEIDPELQIVICSAFSDYSWFEIRKRLGAKDNLLILKKPFDNIEVLQIAHALSTKWILAQTLKCQMSELQRANEHLKKEIFQRRATEIQLKQSEERFANAFKSIPVAVSIQSLESERFIDVNQKFCDLVELGREDIRGRKVGDLDLPGLSTERLAILNSLAERKSVGNLEHRFVTKKGEEKFVLLSADIFQSSGKKFALVSELDISDRVKLETKMRQAGKMEAVGQLSAGIAHDFNNVLTIIQCSAEILLSQSKSGVKHLQNILAASTHASHLTKQLVAFARQQVMDFKACNLNQIIETLSQMVARTLGACIQLKCSFAKENLMIFADECSVEQALLNLALNARDAMENGGELTITTERRSISASQLANPDASIGEYACLCVSDNGCGMNEEVKAKLFEPFFTTKQLGKGSGLGLASVYGIIKQHKGWVEVESTPGAGTTFILFFPSSDKQIETKGQPSEPKGVRGTEAVLIVEDEENLVHILKQSLELFGYEVFVAGKCSEALRMWEKNQHKIKLVLTDVILPGEMSGLELAKHLQLLDPNLKVLITTGYGADLVRKGSDLPDQFTFLPKPFSPTELALALRRSFDSGLPENGRSLKI
jgi:two-component system cell cycle sensor histidine kinase/response regulator CckA